MLSLLWLLPVTLLLGLGGVALFSWSVRSGQYDDLDAAAYRILDDDGPPGPRRDGSRRDGPWRDGQESG